MTLPIFGIFIVKKPYPVIGYGFLFWTVQHFPFHICVMIMVDYIDNRSKVVFVYENR